MGITPVSLKSNLAARAAKHTVSMAINSSSNVVVGSPIAIQLLIRNPLSTAKNIKFGIRASSMYYNGEQGEVLKLERLVFVMKGRDTKKLTFIIYADEYLGKLKDFNTIYIEAVARCEKGLDRVVDRLALITPHLKITAPQSVNVNESFSVKVQFKNPLNKILKNCVFVVEGTRLERRMFPVGDIAAKAIGGTILKLRSSNPYLETVVIYFHANNLREVTGVFQLQVVGKRKHYFAMYSPKRTPQNKPRTQNGLKGGQRVVTSPDQFRVDLINF
ncbi:hemocyte protein-glutamine gamma-glutamyltransferase-like protein [Leptotrombidium deliense]|uniref:Hemocyte protein-glutamine gamma-glutamyltransferase-like protein n=1 Tax=Leptotrombidium deliense TaxID=299467 RepID=A0A443RY36_9ACAR|nr:hemocyte protein-glutamine gamma-glutamyltransferase-like protein [Leptotrombidium deliense]